MAKLVCLGCGSTMFFGGKRQISANVQIRCRNCGGMYQLYKPAKRPAPIDKTIRPWTKKGDK